jgi:hypothetical protein
VQKDNVVVTKYPLLVRVGLSLVCLLLAGSILRGHARPKTIVTAFVAISVDVLLLAYRAEVDHKEIRIRFAPFYVKRTPMRDVKRLSEQRTAVVLVTSTGRIPLWGLTSKTRTALFRILPAHLDFVSTSERQSGPAVSMRRHRRWTIYAGVGFAVTSALLVPFLDENPLNKYWNVGGKYLLLLCMCFFLALIFEAAITWICWSYLRDSARTEKKFR